VAVMHCLTFGVLLLRVFEHDGWHPECFLCWQERVMLLPALCSLCHAVDFHAGVAQVWLAHECTVVPVTSEGTSEEHNSFSHMVSTPCATVSVQQCMSGYFVQ
jgi:hypothetical protein